MPARRSGPRHGRLVGRGDHHDFVGVIALALAAFLAVPPVAGDLVNIRGCRLAALAGEGRQVEFIRQGQEVPVVFRQADREPFFKILRRPEPGCAPEITCQSSGFPSVCPASAAGTPFLSIPRAATSTRKDTDAGGCSGNSATATSCLSAGPTAVRRLRP